MISFLSYCQSPSPNLEKLISDLSKGKNSHIKQVTTQTLTVNSSTKATLGSGSTRAVMKVQLPVGTTAWFYRVTLMDINTNYNYPDSESYYTLLKDKKPMTVNNQTPSGIDFYLLDKSAVNSFLIPRNKNFNHFTKYYRRESIGFVESCDLVSNDLWIGINNPNLRQGIKAIVEIVAMGNY